MARRLYRVKNLLQRIASDKLVIRRYIEPALSDEQESIAKNCKCPSPPYFSKFFLKRESIAKNCKYVSLLNSRVGKPNESIAKNCKPGVREDGPPTSPRLNLLQRIASVDVRTPDGHRYFGI